jgi:hypothetical protein
MGITPITGLTPLPLARSIQADLDPLPMERVENSPRTGDETYSPSRQRSSRGSEDDASEDDEEYEEDFNSEPARQSAPTSTAHSQPISFFA